MSLHPQQARTVLALLWPHAIEAAASPLRPPPCPCCGGVFELGVQEVWEHRDFLLDACCEGAHERAADLLNEDPRQAAELLRLLDIDALCGHRLRRVAEDDGAGRLVLDWRLEIRAVRYSTARDFVRQHHAHCASPPPGWKFGAGAFNGPDLIGVAMVSRPAARLVDASRTLEVRRLCVRRDLPRPLTHNACSTVGAGARPGAAALSRSSPTRCSTSWGRPCGPPAGRRSA